MDYHLFQSFIKLLFRPVYPVLLYIPFCPLLSFSDFIIYTVLLTLLQKILVHAVLLWFFLAALYFLTFPDYPVLSVLNLLSWLSLLSCLSCLYFPEQPLHSFTLPLLPAQHPAQRSSYFQPLSCLLLSVLSPVLSVTTDLFC
jgi:hypothetical protein